MLSHRDPIYGSYEIDGVLEELVRSEGMQRLKEVHQNGAIYLVDPDMDTTRYEHSLGTTLLCMRFGAAKEEQIAALIHDLSHTAFSHVADHVFDRREQDYHELFIEKLVRQYGIDAVLEREGFDVEYMLEEDNFPMLEQPLPSICADRLDYCLRDLFKAGLRSEDDIETILDGIVVEDGRLRAGDQDTAWRLLRAFIELNREVFFDPQHEVADMLMSDLIREALQEDVLTEDDLFQDDEHVIDVLDDSPLRDKLLDIDPETPFRQDPDGPWVKHRKFRLVDPVVAGTGERLSALDPAAEQELQRFRREVQETVRYTIY